ncbi:ABC-2 type transport system ATP-binding protein [Psychromicrobium silvestre]|uniref:ABC-2 type transport system ATP-binding protein n=1 Tax=Psychromicrobium silvestre TaxID=1645614 RepID=A0A7Y9S6A5_9MICC|nr:ABC transporter ATP-binding protein [Psychromicrobium silvestre]NYE95344.1 ABC-2 type transport system ATP-binding protein [Psychromicrobium silvestre]
MSGNAMVSWQRVSKEYAGKPALLDFSLDLGPGVHCLLGPNGAGKTTALNILTGIRSASSGEVQLLGQRVSRGGKQARSLGCVPQSLSFPPTLKVVEVLRFIAVHYPDPLDFAELETKLDLAGILPKQCGSLSGGQLRRLGIAAAIMSNAPVLILDEPLAGLDIDGRAAVRHLLLEQQEQGRCVIMASHDYAEIEATADTVTLMQDGRKLATGSIAEIRDTLDISYLSFESPAAPPTELATLGTLQELGAGRYRLITKQPDPASKLIVELIPQPRLQISQSSLEDAVSNLLKKEAGQ